MIYICSTEKLNLKISIWILSDLKTLNPVSNSKQNDCVTHNKIKTIFMKIPKHSITKSKLGNPSDQKKCIDVLQNWTRRNLKILEIEWVVLFWSVCQFYKKGDQNYRRNNRVKNYQNILNLWYYKNPYFVILTRETCVFYFKNS